MDLARRRGRVLDEAHALAGLGRCSLAAGHATEGEDSLRQALALYQQLGVPEAVGLAAELDAASS